MLQFYFLSVFLSLLVGFILFFGNSAGQEDEQESPVEQKKNPDDDISFLDTDYRGVKLPHQKKSVNGMFGKNSVLNDKLFQLVLGILSVFVGLIKLLSAVNGIPFLGDLLPALAGLLGGAALLFKYYLETSSADLELPPFLQNIFVDNRKYIGLACMIVAVIHFIVPGVLFL